VLHLQRHILRTAVGASVPPFLQQILLYLITVKFPPLVLDAGDLRVLELLGVEFGQLHRDGCDGHIAQKPASPGLDVGDAALQRRREPALLAAPVVEAGLAISALTVAPCPAQPRPLHHPPVDLLAAVLHLRRPDEAAGVLAQDGQARYAAAGVDFQPVAVGD